MNRSSSSNFRRVRHVRSARCPENPALNAVACGLDNTTNVSSNDRHHSSKYVMETGWPFAKSSMMLMIIGMHLGRVVKPSLMCRDQSHSGPTSGHSFIRSSSCRCAIFLRGFFTIVPGNMVISLSDTGADRGALGVGDPAD